MDSHKTTYENDPSEQSHVNAQEDQSEQHESETGHAFGATDDTQEQLTQCLASLAEWQEKYARLTADLENYEKRTTKERSAWAQAAQEKLLRQILTIVDNFDRAIEHQADVPHEMQSWVDGIAMIHADFKEFLKNAGVKEMSYDVFNPEFHEALMQVDSDEKESGEIVTVMEKGYMLHDRVLRPAKVSVAT